jgi:hypothetical protein
MFTALAQYSILLSDVDPIFYLDSAVRILINLVLDFGISPISSRIQCTIKNTI